MRQEGFVKRFMSVPEVANYFSVSRSYIYDLVSRGKLQSWHPDKEIGSRGIRITVESVRELELGGFIDRAEGGKWHE